MARKLTGGCVLAALAGMSLAVSTAAQPDVAVVVGWDDTNDCRFVHVRDILMASGLFNTVTLINGTTSTPTLVELQVFQAVLTFSDQGYQDPDQFGNVLADYVDAGGGVVMAVFSNASVPIAGRWEPDYEVIIGRSGQTQGTRETLGTVLQPGHPVMAGVSTFDGGESSYRPTATVLRPGATEIARWSDGLILVAEGANPKRIDLGFFPPPSTCRSDFWDINTDGEELLANSLAYVAGSGPCYPDCDTSTGVGNLDIFDFLCFQNRFAASAPYACDCDTSTGVGVCDIFDFLCFQNAFDAGCP
jgi:hypothetical protein